MQITLYLRTYPAEGAPVSVSFVPFSARERHTFAAGGVVYESECKELLVVVPDGATIVAEKQRLNWGPQKGSTLSWAGEKGAVASTAKEVYELARAAASGFRLVE